MGEANTYRKGLKGISVFGGLQVYKILISMCTTKVSAIFLGPIGLGIYGLFTSTLTTIEMLISCGLGVSSVKDIAQAKESGDKGKVATVYTVLSRLSWITGLVGCLVCLFGAKWLSRSAFGNDDYTWGFVAVSATILFSQIITAQGALMTGLRDYGLIAKLRIGVSTASLVLVAGLYWWLGVKGIVPVILLSSLFYVVASSVLSHRKYHLRAQVAWKDTFRLGAAMFKGGVFLSLSYLFIALTGYLIRIFISHVGDAATVGLFVASFSLVNTYLGLVLSSIEADFYPRLSGAADDKELFDTTIRQELELVLLMVVPLVVVMMIFSQPMLAVFYSTKFFAAKGIIIWTALSIVIRVPGWIGSVTLMAKGKNRIYLYNKVICSAYQLGLNMLGFYYWGLIGLGVSYCVSELLASLQMWIVLGRMGIRSLTRKSVLTCMLLVGAALGVAVFATLTSGWLLYGAGSVLTALIGGYCLVGLDRRVGIRELIGKKLRKR